MVKQNQVKLFGLILVAALAIRLVLIFPQYSGDIKNHVVWSQAFLQDSSSLYSVVFSGFNQVNYPPLSLYFFVVSYWLFLSFQSLVHFLNNTFTAFPSALVGFFDWENTMYAFMKLPGVLADLGILILLYLRYKHMAYLKYLLPALFAFSLPVMYVSSVWGQTESITLFFILFAVHLAPIAPLWILPIFTLAALQKQTALWLSPFVLVLAIKRLKPNSFILSCFISLATFLFSYLPFFSSPIAAISSYLSTLAGSSTVVSDQAWNLWWFIFGQADDSLTFAGLSVRLWSIILLLISLLFTLYFQIRNKIDTYTAMFLFSLCAFFLQTRVHERHLYPALILVLFLQLKLLPKVTIFILLSIYFMLNLYFSLRLPFI